MVVEEKRKFYNIWKKSGNEEDRLLYCLAERKAKQAVYKAQSDEQKLLGKMLDAEDKRNGVFRVVKQMVRKNRDVVGEGCIKGLDGKLLTSEFEVKTRWMAHFEKLINKEF